VSTAVVTGGSKGIGRAIAVALAPTYQVAILDPLPEGSQVVADIEALGSRGLHLAVDVSDDAAALEMPFADWMPTVTVNLGGTFICSRSLAPCGAATTRLQKPGSWL
jgi:NAD(P)-dependent dehydrogenase (short-subunit alcohol dehydrogenase family)